MALFRSHKAEWRKLLFAGALMIAALALFASSDSAQCGSVHASDTNPVDYCFVTDIAITNNTGGPLTDQMVRVEVNGSGLVGAGQLDPRAWDAKPVIGSFANEVHLTAQGLTEPDSAFWFQVPSIADGVTQTVRMYSGSDEQRRDQGIFFTGGDYVTVPDHGSLDITDRLDVILDIRITDETARDEWIIDKNTGAAGYSILLQDVASVLNLTFKVDGLGCQLPWDSAWTDTVQTFFFEYDIAAGLDTDINRNGSLETSCDLDVGALSANSQDVIVGSNETDTSPLTGAEIYRAWIGQDLIPSMDLNFNARRMIETSDTNPYTGTVSDVSGNTNDGVYTFDRDQTNISYTVAATRLQAAAPQLSLADPLADVFGDPFDTSARSEVNSGIFYDTFLNQWASAAPVATFGYVVLLSAFGLLMAIAVWRLTKWMPLSLFVFGIPIAAGVGNGWIPPYWMVLWIVVALGGWFAQRQAEN